MQRYYRLKICALWPAANVTQFDNITTTPAASPPVPVPYYYLYYQSFVTRSVTINPPVSGPIPNTGNNYAVTSVRTQVTSGMPLLSVNYPVSTTVAFQLLSFFFACSTNTLNSEILSPTPCTLAITGYKGSDNTVASNQMVAAQTIRYIPSAMTGPVQMAKFVVLPAFNGATFVTFQYTNDLNTALTPTTAMAIDTVKYTVYNCN